MAADNLADRSAVLFRAEQTMSSDPLGALDPSAVLLAHVDQLFRLTDG